jgi:c-di-GMP-related signal transduction protein
MSFPIWTRPWQSNRGTTVLFRLLYADIQVVDVFVARQAIFDRDRQVNAYELLFRSDSRTNAFDGTEATLATTQVVANSLFAIGLENVLSGKRAFLNLGRGLLTDGWHSIFPKEVAVLEVLETVEPGYTIALDDFVCHPRFEPLVQFAALIKVDMRTTSKAEQERMVRVYKPRGIEMLAEKVETYEEFRWARSIGYDYFQGYFFTRPVIVRGRQIPASKILCLRLIQEAQRATPDFRRLEELISQDISLCYKLLRYVNSALFQRLTPVNSIHDALVSVGENGIRRWATLAALPLLAADKPSELVTLSIVRAHFCECVARLVDIPEHEAAFLLGLFSLLDALIDRPLDEALSQVRLAPAIANVLLGVSPEADRFTMLYRLARCYEAEDWDAVETLAAQLRIPASAIGEAYLVAVQRGSEWQRTD